MRLWALNAIQCQGENISKRPTKTNRRPSLLRASRRFYDWAYVPVWSPLAASGFPMNSDENPYFDAGAASSSGAGAGAEHAGAGNAGGSRANSLTAATSRTQTPTITPLSEEPPTTVPQPPASLARSVFFRPVGDRQQSSIRLRRLSNPVAPELQTIPSADESEQQSQTQTQQASDNGLLRPLSRFRSGSRSRAGSNALPLGQLPTIQDGVAQDFATGSHPAQVGVRTNDGNVAPAVVVPSQGGGSRLVPVNTTKSTQEYDSNIVDILDVIGECSVLHRPQIRPGSH
jgi:hypothetical protein